MAQESKNSNLGLQSEAESLQQQYREAAENFAAKDSSRKAELNEAEERIAELQQALEASEESLAAAREELQETGQIRRQHLRAEERGGAKVS